MIKSVGLHGTVKCSTLATLSQSSKTKASKLPLKNTLITTSPLCLSQMWFYSSDFGVARLLQFTVYNAITCCMQYSDIRECSFLAT